MNRSMHRYYPPRKRRSDPRYMQAQGNQNLYQVPEEASGFYESDKSYDYLMSLLSGGSYIRNKFKDAYDYLVSPNTYSIR